MNLIEEAKALGFSDAAVISTDQLVFVPEYRVFCEDNLCGNYDKKDSRNRFLQEDIKCVRVGLILPVKSS